MEEKNTKPSTCLIVVLIDFPGPPLDIETGAMWAGMAQKAICGRLDRFGFLSDEVPSSSGPEANIFGNRQLLAVGNEGLGFFLVTNKFGGLTTIIDELESLGQRDYAKVAWPDPFKKGFRFQYPRHSRGSYISSQAVGNKLQAIIKAVRK